MNTNFLKRKGVKKVSQKCNPQAIDRFTLGGTLVAMGVVYGDIGTSPLYVMKAIVDGNGGLDHVSETFILGAVSLVFWTLTLLTTIKYVMIALNADNHGEGGIFSLFTLVRKNSRYLLYPAMLGGATLLADGILTPAVTVTTAVEGLRGIPSFHNMFGDSQQIIVIITVIIIFSLFMVQRLGTKKVGTAFGPIMFGWFTFIGLIGLSNFMGNLSVIRALNPYYAVHLLFSEENKLGILILGSVFLATTGAEALYSDLGHAGRNNIRVSWPYIKVCLVLNYFGQAAWIIRVKDLPEYQDIGMLNPFFRMMPQSLTIIGVIFATVAAIIASQSLISGSYTLASEAIKLRLLPRMKIIYPTDQKGQLYIPAINNMLMVGCLAIVFGFRTSARMEAAYGLAITITMLMTTILLLVYLLQEGTPKSLAYLIFIFFGTIESIFFVSSASKFMHGGYVALGMALVIFLIMLIWHRGNMITEATSKRISLYDYKGQLGELRDDTDWPQLQTNLVFLTSKIKGHLISREIMYSILDKSPKRAKVYWFVNVFVTDEPYTKEYYVDMMDTDYIVNVQLRLGFKMPQEVNVYLRQIVHDLMNEGKLPKQPQKYSITPGRDTGDFSFVLIREELSRVTELNWLDTLVMQAKLGIKRRAVDPAKWYGLEYSDVITEYVPLVIQPKRNKVTLKQVPVEEFDEDDDELHNL